LETTVPWDQLQEAALAFWIFAMELGLGEAQNSVPLLEEHAFGVSLFVISATLDDDQEQKGQRASSAARNAHEHPGVQGTGSSCAAWLRLLGDLHRQGTTQTGPVGMAAVHARARRGNEGRIRSSGDGPMGTVLAGPSWSE
jgi:hypothetical protein